MPGERKPSDDSLVEESARDAAAFARGADPLKELSRAVDGELRDLASALRRLDQSYMIRGYQSRKAATAGSVFVDWRARGIDLPRAFQPAPPPPRFFDCARGCRDARCGCDARFGCGTRCGCATRSGCGTRCAEGCDVECQPGCDVDPDAGCDDGRRDFSSLFTFRADGPVVWKLMPDDAARCDAEGWLMAGAVRVTAIERRVADAVRAANAWTIEFDLEVPPDTASRAATQAATHAALVTFGDDVERANLALRLEERTLVATFRTAAGARSARHDVPLATLEPGRRRVAVSYAPGRLTAWVDGVVATATNAVTGDLGSWTPQSMTLGQRGVEATRAPRLGRVVFAAAERTPEGTAEKDR